MLDVDAQQCVFTIILCLLFDIISPIYILSIVAYKKKYLPQFIRRDALLCVYAKYIDIFNRYGYAGCRRTAVRLCDYLNIYNFFLKKKQTDLSVCLKNYYIFAL